MSRSNEPLVWSLFSAGGVVAALLMPVHILLLGLLLPLGWVATWDIAELVNMLGHPVTRLYLFVFVSLPLFHWAHRFRYLLVDLGLKKADAVIAVSCYGTAVVGTLLTAWLVWRL